MKRSGLIAVVCLLSLALFGTWWWFSARAYQARISEGIHSYLRGDWAAARRSFERALERRDNPEVRKLLMKVELEEVLSRRSPADKRAAPKAVRELLSDLHLVKPAAGESEIKKALETFQKQQQEGFEDFRRGQDRALAGLLQRQDEMRNVVWIAFAACGLAGLLLTAFSGLFFSALYGRRGVFAHLGRIENRLLDGPSNSLTNEFRKIDIIEAELLNESGGESARKLLRPFLEEEDPWIKARAAKAMFAVDPSAALAELGLLAEGSRDMKLAALWASGELSCLESLKIMERLLADADTAVCQAAARSLVQIQSRHKTPPDVLQAIEKTLSEFRAKTGWIV